VSRATMAIVNMIVVMSVGVRKRIVPKLGPARIVKNAKIIISAV